MKKFDIGYVVLLCAFVGLIVAGCYEVYYGTF